MRILSTVVLQGGFDDANRVDPAIDDLERLLSGLLSQCGLLRPSQTPANFVSRSGKRPAAAVAQIYFLFDGIANVFDLSWINGLQNHSIASARSFGMRFLDLKTRFFGGVLCGDCVVLSQPFQ